MLNQHKTTLDNIARYNKSNLLAHYLLPFIGAKTEVRIADIGSGPYSVIGDHLNGVKLQIWHSDNKDFSDFYKKYNFNPIIIVENQNMEQLTYPDNSFDIVHCANALDHTKNAFNAITEMMRVCKPGGYVYIVCNLDQAHTGHKHFWNAKEDGVLVSENGKVEINLKNLGFVISYMDLGGERRYNQIIAIYHKE